jgi:hypothetical protein
MLIVFGLVALAFGYWRRSVELRNQAAFYHAEALRTGYLAVRKQRPTSPEWEADWRRNWVWPSALAMDRTSIRNALPMWQQSLENERQCDLCLHSVYVPSFLWSWALPHDELPPLPADDGQLVRWWQVELGAHVQKLGLDQAYGYSLGQSRTHLQRSVWIHNIAADGVRAKLSWEKIRQIMPVEDGYLDESELR